MKDAPVRLITAAVSRMAVGKTVGRARVMRRSLLETIDNGKPGATLTAFLAPSVVATEGAARRSAIAALVKGGARSWRGIFPSAGSAAPPRPGRVTAIIGKPIVWHLRYVFQEPSVSQQSSATSVASSCGHRAGSPRTSQPLLENRRGAHARVRDIRLS